MSTIIVCPTSGSTPPYLLPVKCYLVIAVSRFKLNGFSTRSVHSTLLSGRVFIEAPFGTKEPPSLMPALAGQYVTKAIIMNKRFARDSYCILI